jgi:hypothetical protein
MRTNSDKNMVPRMAPPTIGIPKRKAGLMSSLWSFLRLDMVFYHAGSGNGTGVRCGLSKGLFQVRGDSSSSQASRISPCSVAHPIRADSCSILLRQPMLTALRASCTLRSLALGQTSNSRPASFSKPFSRPSSLAQAYRSYTNAATVVKEAKKLPRVNMVCNERQNRPFFQSRCLTKLSFPFFRPPKKPLVVPRSLVRLSASLNFTASYTGYN